MRVNSFFKWEENLYIYETDSETETEKDGKIKFNENESEYAIQIYFDAFFFDKTEQTWKNTEPKLSYNSCILNVNTPPPEFY